MTTILNRREAGNANPLADLRECLGEQILLKLALDAVQSVGDSKLKAAVNGDSKLRPQMILTLLSFCYAARIYGSREIERAARTDKTVRYICARIFPNWQAIRQFRRNNRELLEQCLTYVLKKSWVLQCETDLDWAICAGSGPGLDEKCAAAAREKIDVAIIMDTGESD